MLTGRRAVRGKGSRPARQRADHEAVPRAERAAAGSSGVDRRRPRPRAGEVAGRSRSVDCARFAQALLGDAGALRPVALGGAIRRPRGGGLLATYELGERLGAGRLGSESLQRHASRARASRRDPPAAPRQPSAAGTLFARGFSARRRRCRSRIRRSSRCATTAKRAISSILVTDLIDGPQPARAS